MVPCVSVLSHVGTSGPVSCLAILDQPVIDAIPASTRQFLVSCSHSKYWRGCFLVLSVWAGENSGIPDATMAPNPVTPSAGGCTGKVDAVTTSQDRSTYIFEGECHWSINVKSRYIARVSALFDKGDFCFHQNSDNFFFFLLKRKLIRKEISKNNLQEVWFCSKCKN